MSRRSTEVRDARSVITPDIREAIAVHEVLAVDHAIRRMIIEHASVEEITHYAREHQKMRTLKESGQILVEEGLTTPEELMKISYE